MVDRKIKYLISALLMSSNLLTGCLAENLSSSKSEKNNVIKLE